MAPVLVLLTLASAPLLRLCSASGGLSIVALGDWGGHSNEEPTTADQRLTAVGLTRKAFETNASFALLMGDNFYQHGIAGDETSTRFHDTFEALYAKLLPGRPFYAFAGNHDYGEGLAANVSAQLAYARRSEQWKFPSLWYAIHRDFEADGQQRSLDVLVIDTVVLCGNGAANAAFIDEELHFLGDIEPSVGQSRREAAAEAQWAWLEQNLKGSSADFLWVAGHYPIWSAGNDGSQQCLVDRLQPLLLMHGAHYISGHDHMLEHFVHEGLNTFVVGAGKECCYPPVKMWTTPPGSMQYMLAGRLGAESRPPTAFPVRGGFAGMVFGAEAVTVTLYAHDGSTLYQAPPIARRDAPTELSSLVLFLVDPRLFLAAGLTALAASVVTAKPLTPASLRLALGEGFRDSGRAPLLAVY